MSWFNIQNQNWSVCITFNPYLRIAYLARRRPPPFRSFPPRKMSRNIARALVPEQGPEAAAIVNLNSEETRPLGEKKYNVGGVGGCLGRVMGYTHRIFFWGGGGYYIIHGICGVSLIHFHHGLLDCFVESRSEDEVCWKSVLWLSRAHCIHDYHICCADPLGNVVRMQPKWREIPKHVYERISKQTSGTLVWRSMVPQYR